MQYTLLCCAVLCCAEVRSGDLLAPLQLATGDKVVFTIVEGADGTDNRIGGELWRRCLVHPPCHTGPISSKPQLRFCCSAARQGCLPQCCHLLKRMAQ